MDESRYLGTADLARRCSNTTRGVRNLILNELDFPTPAFAINEGRIRVWTLAEIEAWEALHPETQSDRAKQQKTLYPATFRRTHNLPLSRAKTTLSEP